MTCSKQWCCKELQTSFKQLMITLGWAQLYSSSRDGSDNTQFVGLVHPFSSCLSKQFTNILVVAQSVYQWSPGSSKLSIYSKYSVSKDHLQHCMCYAPYGKGMRSLFLLYLVSLRLLSNRGVCKHCTGLLKCTIILCTCFLCNCLSHVPWPVI